MDVHASYYQQLLKLYKRKGKKQKPEKLTSTDDVVDMPESNHFYNSEDDSDFDTDSDDEEDELSDGEDAAHGSLNECPDGCSPEVYERIKLLRDKRLANDTDYQQCERQLQDIQKQQDRLQYRLKQSEKECEHVQQEIEAFETEKQQQLNQIEIVVPLKLHQLQYLVRKPQHHRTSSDDMHTNQNYKDQQIQHSNGAYGLTLPPTLNNALVVHHATIDKLKSTIASHHHHRQLLQQQLNEIKTYTKQLGKQIRSKQQLVEIEQKKCDEIQLLKFGQLIDLSILDSVQQDPVAVQLESELRQVESANKKQVHSWQQKLDEARADLQKAIQTNTEWLQRLAMATQRQLALDEQLKENSSASSNKQHKSRTGSAYDQQRMESEKQRLLSVTSEQEQQIEMLKNEIHALQHKTGSLYTQTQQIH